MRFNDFKDFMGRRTLPVTNDVGPIKDGPESLNKLANVWRILVFQRANSVAQGLVKHLTFYLTTRDHPLSNPHDLSSAGVGGP